MYEGIRKMKLFQNVNIIDLYQQIAKQLELIFYLSYTKTIAIPYINVQLEKGLSAGTFVPYKIRICFHYSL